MFNRPLANVLALNGSFINEQETEGQIAETRRDLDRHVIICGYGRPGQNPCSMVKTQPYQEQTHAATQVHARERRRNLTQPTLLRE